MRLNIPIFSILNQYSLHISNRRSHLLHPISPNMALSIAKPTTVPNPPKSPIPSLTHLHHHSTVTSEFDPLRFEAAASLQLQPELKSTEQSTHLIASPYNHPAHLLDISALEKQDRLFALALSYLKPIRNDYATAPYTESFNWTEVFDLVKAFSETEEHDWTAGSYYVVIFRSILLPDIDKDRLYDLDAHSHREAIASGGLLKYWFGAKNEDRRNLATCEYSFFFEICFCFLEVKS